MTRVLNTRIAAMCMLLVCAFAIAASATSQAASTSTSVVGATVLSSTTIDAASCASGVLGRTDFGPVTAGSSNVTTLDCDIRFGSSNDTAQLRARQTDLTGRAMFSPTRGALDTAFDTDGRATTAIAAGAGGDYANAGAIQADGRFVSAGECSIGGATGWDACLTRHDTDGSLDTSFDTDGRVSTAIAPGANGEVVHDIAIQPDGRIVTAGGCDMGGATETDACLARYNPDGSLDTSFDTDGVRTTAAAPGAGSDSANAITVQPDGRIVTAGGCDMGGATGSDMCLARYNPDGSLDTTFDTDGLVTTAIAPGATSDTAAAVAIQPDGRIVAAGWCDIGAPSGLDACLARYNTDGSLDTTFDTDGRVTTSTGPGAGTDSADGVAIQPDGRIITAGRCAMGGATGTDTCLARYDTSGALDTTFDTDGRATAAIAPGAAFDGAAALAIQPDGRIVTAGECSMVATAADACLARLNMDGSLDTTFDSDGRVITATAPGANTDSATAVAIRPDGGLVTAGFCSMGGTTGSDVCLAAYAANGTLEQYTDDGVRDWDTAGSAPSLFGACLRTVSGGASAQWATSATCPATDGAYWNDVPVASERIAYTTALEPDPPDATASLRFGLRAGGSQPAGAYLAPITFDVLAPNV